MGSVSLEEQRDTNLRIYALKTQNPEYAISQYKRFNVRLSPICVRGRLETMLTVKPVLHLALVWLFLATASLALIGSGSFAGIGEFWEK